MLYEDEKNRIRIKANKIHIGSDVRFGTDIDVDCADTFSIGDYSYLGSKVSIKCRTAIFGQHLYVSEGLRVGVSRKLCPNAVLRVGDRCTLHNNMIDLAKEVTIGDDVGLSPEVAIYTHGYWQSVLDGYPAKYAPVFIGSGTIVGFRSTILAGAVVGENAVIGAHTLVNRSLDGNCVYAGNPARMVSTNIKPTKARRVILFDAIIKEYRELASYRGFEPALEYSYPEVKVAGCKFNVESMKMYGRECKRTDDFRDFLFRHGIRFYTSRPFKQYKP